MMVMSDPRCDWFFRLAALCVLGVGGFACQPSPVASPAEAGPPATRPVPADAAALADVLQHAVTPGGWVVVDDLEERAERLKAYLTFLETHGPTATPAEYPTAPDRLAYWLNAHAAWSLELGLRAGCPERLTPAQVSQAFRLDGRMQRLSDIDAALAGEWGWRAPAGAPGVTMDRAAPPRRPFTPSEVEKALQERLDAFIYDDERFEIDVASRQIRVPPVLWGRRQEIIERYAKAYRVASPSFWSALQDAVGGQARRRLQDAVGYQVVEAPPDHQTCFKKWYELLD